jgi:transposase
MSKVIFKPYKQNQMFLLPPSIEEMIASNHPVRIVNEIIDRINIKPLINLYKGGGSSSYNAKMMLKVLVYGYLRNIYSSRKIEEMTKENIHMMWIAGMNKPDHHTINRFRSERLSGRTPSEKKVLEEIFSRIVELLVETGQLSITELYVDGTKIEANANKYTFVWGKSIKKSKERIRQQLKELWQYTQRIAEEENKEENDDDDFEEIDPEKVKQTIEKIDECLKDKAGVSKKIKQKINYAKKNWSARLEKYKEQQEMLGKRNSYSKTDEEATFMRMKEDSMKNGQLKAGYNVQISSNNQYIVNYSIHQRPTDTTTLPEHIESFKEKYDQLPEVIVADAGYGSEENYQYMEENKIEGYVKYNYFDREQKKQRGDKNPFSAEKLYYNEKEDCYYCPMGQKMSRVGQKKRVTENNYVREITEYKAINCQGCPIRGVCHKGQEDRIIGVSHKGNYLKQRAREKLESDIGIRYRKKRPTEAEPVFGNIKQNKKFKRFLLRGIEKVKIEFGLVAISHNLKKFSLAIA